MGGKSKSSTSTASTMIDRRIAADGNATVIMAENSQVDFLTDEALEQALNFGGSSLELVENVVTKALNTFVQTQGQAFDATLDSVSKAYGQTALALESQRSEGLQGFKQFLMAGVGVAAIVSVAYVMRSKR